MIRTHDMARALLRRDALVLRQLAQEALEDTQALTNLERPEIPDPVEAAAAASVVELLCQRAGIASPQWTSDVPPLQERQFVVAAALSMPRLRALCETESPAPMMRRGFLAPPDFLTFA